MGGRCDLDVEEVLNSATALEYFKEFMRLVGASTSIQTHFPGSFEEGGGCRSVLCVEGFQKLLAQPRCCPNSPNDPQEVH